MVQDNPKWPAGPCRRLPGLPCMRGCFNEPTAGVLREEATQRAREVTGEQDPPPEAIRGAVKDITQVNRGGPCERFRV